MSNPNPNGSIKNPIAVGSKRSSAAARRKRFRDELADGVQVRLGDDYYWLRPDVAKQLGEQMIKAAKQAAAKPDSTEHLLRQVFGQTS